jgi:O-antigen ligase
MLRALSYEKLLSPEKVFIFLAIILLSSLFAGLYFEAFYLMLFPFAALLVLVALIDFTKIYYLMIMVIPITIEIYLPNGLGIDLPTEPILIGLTLLFPFILLMKFKAEHLELLTNPIVIALLFHIGWILIAAVLGADVIVGLKFFMAKLWYIVPFFFLSIYVFRGKKEYKYFFWLLMIPLALSICYVLVRHSSYGFSFSDVNSAVSPIYRNHVNYGLLMAGFLPFVWCFYHWYEKGSFERILIGGTIILMLIGIYFTYTRAAQLAVVIGVGAYFIIRFRLVLLSLISATLLVLVLTTFLLNEDRYLEYAPQYEKTITHESFDNLLEATVKMEDISTMERVNRWVAGYHMAVDRPFSGFGPGNFYFNYKNYMVSSFVTYVSDNPDKSGIHNYYLMTLVEQGFVGLLFFLALLFSALLYGERLYHRIKDSDYQKIVMAATVSIIVIASVILINDLLEALKIGSLFFISMAILVREGVRMEKLNN